MGAVEDIAALDVAHITTSGLWTAVSAALAERRTDAAGKEGGSLWARAAFQPNKRTKTPAING